MKVAEAEGDRGVAVDTHFSVASFVGKHGKLIACLGMYTSKTVVECLV